MTSLLPLMQGFIIGLSIAAPVGPLGVLCIKKTLNEGKLAGFLCGLGIAVGDSIYGAVAAFGLAMITHFLTGNKAYFQIIGGAFLLYLGIKTILQKPADPQIFSRKGKHQTFHFSKKLLQNFFSTVFLTLTNPPTILSFIAIFAGLGLANLQNNYFSAALMVTGLFLGSLSWWLFLTESINLVRKKITQNTLRWVNVLSGLTLVAFGATCLVKLI